MRYRSRASPNRSTKMIKFKHSTDKQVSDRELVGYFVFLLFGAGQFDPLLARNDTNESEQNRKSYSTLCITKTLS